MNIVKGWYFFFALITYELIKEIGFRVISVLFYPIACILQKQIRNNLYKVNKELVQEWTWKDSRDIEVRDFFKKVNKLYFFLWLFLDDSTAKDSYHSDDSLMWNASDNDAHYPKWVLKTKCFWLRVM